MRRAKNSTLTRSASGRFICLATERSSYTLPLQGEMRKDCELNSIIIAPRGSLVASSYRVPLVAALLLGLVAFSASPAKAGADNRLSTLSGYWRLKDKANAEPTLTSWARTEMSKPDRKGDVSLESEQWCIFQGMPYVMNSAGPIEIRQSPGETIVVAERLAVPRHIYFKLESRPSPDVFDFTPVGFSTGQHVDDELVVETDMFSDGIGAEGAPRTENAKLVERFQVSEDGKELMITSSWTDPEVFREPYVYTWTYERLPDDYTPSFYYCDPRANGVGNYPPGEDPRGENSGD